MKFDLMPICEEDAPTRTRRTRGYLWSSLLWLLFPVIGAITTSPSTRDLVGGGLGLAVFVAFYIGIGEGWIGGASPKRAMLALAAAAVDVILMAELVDSGWASLFIFTAALGGIRLPTKKAGVVVLSSVALAFVTQLAAGAGSNQTISITASAIGVGGLMLSLGELLRSNDQLRKARADLARLAVAEERVRFGRDLHDLLGHSLSVIAVKAQLARRLLPERRDEATVHLEDLETVARQALAEVREAVSGYRLPTLEGELAGARLALEAAGIEPRLSAVSADTMRGLGPEEEALLAWTVREGTTNVIRHSRARNCSIAVTPEPAHTTVEIRDDGEGPAAVSHGHGLVGLRERADRVGAALEAGPAPDGGFCLRVSVPVGAAQPVLA